MASVQGEDTIATVNTYLSLQVVTIRSSVEITVTRRMLRERAVLIASVGGRAPHEVHRMDWEQAKREMSGIQTADLM